MAKKVEAITMSDALLATQETESVDPVFSQIIAQTTTTPIDRATVIFKLRNPPNGKVHLDGTDDVVDPETGKPRRMRLLRGVSTIWMDEQDKVDKEYANRNRMSLTFVQGGLICDTVKDANVIQAARLMNAFEGNVNRIPGKKRSFYEWDTAAIEKAAFEKELLEMEVVQLAVNQSADKMKKHGLYLGISFQDEMGKPRSDQGIRALYLREAKKDPKRFMDSFDSQEVELNYLVRKYIIEGKIDISSSNIKWANGGLICKLPHSRQPIEYLVEFGMLPTDEAQAFVNRLQKQAV